VPIHVHFGETFVLQYRYREIYGKPQKKEFELTLDSISQLA